MRVTVVAWQLKGAKVQLQARVGGGNGDQVAARQLRRIVARKAGAGDATGPVGRLLTDDVRVEPVAGGIVLGLTAVRFEADQLGAERGEAELSDEREQQGGLGDADGRRGGMMIYNVDLLLMGLDISTKQFF